MVSILDQTKHAVHVGWQSGQPHAATNLGIAPVNRTPSLEVPNIRDSVTRTRK